jgi:hypothetical protein
MKYKEIQKVITKKVSFHDVEDYPSILEASYFNGQVERRWFISREGYLTVKDYSEAMDIDFWVKTKEYVVIDRDPEFGCHEIVKPNHQEKVYLASQSFLDDPRRFWESFNNNVIDVSSKIKLKDLIPIYIHHDTYSIFDLDGKIMRLPMILTFGGSSFRLDELAEHLKKYKEVLDVKIVNRPYQYELYASVDTALLPIPKDVIITSSRLKDMFVYCNNNDYFDVDQFRI